MCRGQCPRSNSPSSVPVSFQPWKVPRNAAGLSHLHGGPGSLSFCFAPKTGQYPGVMWLLSLRSNLKPAHSYVSASLMPLSWDFLRGDILFDFPVTLGLPPSPLPRSRNALGRLLILLLMFCWGHLHSCSWEKPSLEFSCIICPHPVLVISSSGLAAN